ncbi:hypothetical protein PBY51_020934 [Eleginops maclovinus]|uniref:Uncharacterized protein n=1 Tax=Eleginops maclovinus TaxID=56733 RepID=A0AAN7XEZ3_ELEMC|nr:hypothetical protein PBY51_020934 [Eleginops maclovinus]
MGQLQRNGVYASSKTFMFCALVKGRVLTEHIVAESSISRQACGRDQQAERGGTLNRPPVPPPPPNPHTQPPYSQSCGAAEGNLFHRLFSWFRTLQLGQALKEERFWD